MKRWWNDIEKIIYNLESMSFVKCVINNGLWLFQYVISYIKLFSFFVLKIVLYCALSCTNIVPLHAHNPCRNESVVISVTILEIGPDSAPVALYAPLWLFFARTKHSFAFCLILWMGSSGKSCYQVMHFCSPLDLANFFFFFIDQFKNGLSLLKM